MRRRALFLNMRMIRWILGGALTLAVAAPAIAGVGYSVVIEQPAPVPDAPTVIRGAIPVVARAEGGVGDASAAAFDVHPSDQPWSEAQRTPMPALDAARFGAPEPWNSTKVPNGEYDLEVRVWGDVPEYHADRPGTFARGVVRLTVDNPPPPPRLRALVSVRSLRMEWRKVKSSGREDFLGYRLWSARARRCPHDPAAYTMVIETPSTSWSWLDAAPGSVCYRMTSVRTSAVSGEISSVMSTPIHLNVPATAAGAPPGGTIVVEPPRRASAGVVRAEEAQGPGTYRKRLPYAAETVTVGGDDAEAASAEGPAGSGLGREGVGRAAGGLILLAAALHVRRFLFRPVPSRRR